MILRGPRECLQSTYMYLNIFQSEFWGKTGVIRIDGHGERSDFELEILQVASQSEWGSIRVVGSWTLQEGLMWRGNHFGDMNGMYLWNFPRVSV